MAKKTVNIPDPCLVTLVKDDETIKAHPRQVALWLKQGWTEAPVVDEAPPAVDDLIAMIKDGEKMSAHPDQVDAWLAEGWLVAEADDAGDGAGAGN